MLWLIKGENSVCKYFIQHKVTNRLMRLQLLSTLWSWSIRKYWKFLFRGLPLTLTVLYGYL